jgi:hypothetical protein
MKANQIETGKTYLAKVSGRLVPVKVLGVVCRPHYLRMRSDAQHWICLNTTTGRQLEVKSPQRFRQLVSN